MGHGIPESLAIIAGKGVYPRLLAESARRQGVQRLIAIAFKGETDRAIGKATDRVDWLNLGQFGRMLETVRESGVKHAVMAGQITPTNLFRVRPDAKMFEVLGRLKVRNAETIFGAVADELKTIGVELLPASSFMDAHMPAPGVLSRRGPTETEQRDIALGLKAARITSGLDIGQTVVVKEGTILAVEAFEGTNEAIKRAASLGGAGIVVVKAAKRSHDMRFDIPVVGMHTLDLLRKVKASALAVEAGRAILLEQDKLIAEADRIGLCLTAVDAGRE
jgi:hypothetical protein